MPAYSQPPRKQGSKGIRTHPHDFVYFAILLSGDELLLLVGQFYLDTNLTRTSIDEWDILDHFQRHFDRIIGAVDGEGHPFEADLSPRVHGDISKHCLNISGRRCPHIAAFWHSDPPRSTVKLPGLDRSVKALQ